MATTTDITDTNVAAATNINTITITATINAPLHYTTSATTITATPAINITTIITTVNRACACLMSLLRLVLLYYYYYYYTLALQHPLPVQPLPLFRIQYYSMFSVYSAAKYKQ